jgi:hypothetical protein
MTTIVSALITNINVNRSIEKYVYYGIKLMKIPVNKVVYMERHIYDQYFQGMENYNTIIRIIEKTEMYLYEHIFSIKNFNPISTCIEKDTMEYMFVQCSKTEWVKNAIQENFYNSTQFIWLDFGIYHMIQNEKLFYDYVCGLSTKSYDTVRIASGSYNDDFSEHIVVRNIIWKFLGSIFGGDKDSLIKFAELTQKKCLYLINRYKTICWEINVWYLIHKENPHLFSLYNSNHDITILLNY